MGSLPCREHLCGRAGLQGRLRGCTAGPYSRPDSPGPEPACSWGPPESAQREADSPTSCPACGHLPLSVQEGPQRRASLGLSPFPPPSGELSGCHVAPLCHPHTLHFQLLWDNPSPGGAGPTCGQGDTGPGQGLGKVRRNSAGFYFFCPLLAPGTPEFVTHDPDPLQGGREPQHSHESSVLPGARPVTPGLALTSGPAADETLSPYVSSKDGSHRGQPGKRVRGCKGMCPLSWLLLASGCRSRPNRLWDLPVFPKLSVPL